MFSVLGMMVMTAAGELLTAYIALELFTFSMYVLAGFNLKNLKSNEAGVKYILVGAFSTALMLYGISLIYGTLHTTTFAGMAAALKAGPDLPVAFLGLVYYSTLLTWIIGIGRPSHRRRRLHIMPLLLVGMGLAASAYYMNIMFRVLDEWCSWCVATHVLNLLIAICFVVIWPRRLKPATSVTVEGTSSTQDQGSTAPPVPSARTVIITLVAIVIMVWGELNMLGLKTWKRQAASAKESFDTCIDVVKRIKSDSDALLRNWQAATKQEILNGLFALRARMENWAKAPANFGNQDFWDYPALLTEEGVSPLPDQTKVPIQVRRARHNYYFIIRDKSLGIHNLVYSRYLLTQANSELDAIGVSRAASRAQMPPAQILQMIQRDLLRAQSAEVHSGERL